MTDPKTMPISRLTEKNRFLGQISICGSIARRCALQFSHSFTKLALRNRTHLLWDRISCGPFLFFFLRYSGGWALIEKGWIYTR
jgi:hypothetical protein